MSERTGINATDNSTSAEKDRAEQLYILISFWLGALIYGIYLVLFVMAVRIRTKMRLNRTRASRVFYVSMLVMFVLTTIYIGINVYRFSRAFGEDAASPKMPIYYFRDYSTWYNLGFIVIMDLMIWLADALVIYRCFLVWNDSYAIIAIPFLLLLLSIVINSVCTLWVARPSTIAFEKVHPLFDMVFPVNLTQNCLTTGLIAYKIWYQHLESRRAGLFVSPNLNLIVVMRILVESAAIYTVQQLLLLILYFTNQSAQVIFHLTLVPSISLLFVLISIRTYVAKNNNAGSSNCWPQRSSLMLSPWAQNSEISTSRHTRSGGLAMVTTVSVERHSSHILDIHPATEVDVGQEEIGLHELPTIHEVDSEKSEHHYIAKVV